MLEAQQQVQEITDARQKNSTVVERHEDNENMLDDPQIIGEAKSAMHDMIGLQDNDTLTLDKRIDMLNSDQKRIFNNVKKHLVHQRKHELKQCKCNDFKPQR